MHNFCKKNRFLPLTGLVFLILFPCKLEAQRVGEPLAEWSEGYLEIHHINTGLGESAFFILPDGTTMLVDAGVTSKPKPRVTDPRPDDSRTPGEWITRYITHRVGDNGNIRLNYILATHFHNDHIGTVFPDSKLSESGLFHLTGITEIGERMPFDKIVDRGWPDYDYPSPVKDRDAQNYIRFVQWSVQNKKVTAEMIRVGANDQFTMVNAPEKYPDFEIRNLAGNGFIWTGFTNNNRNYFPEGKYPNENVASIAFRLTYGQFNYLNSGDISRSDLLGDKEAIDFETPVGIAAGPVDVCLANHHGHYDAMNVSFLEAVRPRVFILFAFNPLHPAPSTLHRMVSTVIYPGSRDIFATNIMDEQRVVIGDPIKNIKSHQGHIVVRVQPGGDQYRIIILDDSNENFIIKEVYGPYESR